MTALLTLADRVGAKAGLLLCVALLVALFPLAQWVHRRNRPHPTIDQASHDRPDAVQPKEEA